MRAPGEETTSSLRERENKNLSSNNPKKRSKKSFEKESKIWDNYKTDYSPLVEFAKDSSLMFVATNIPRRYASIVYGKGFEGLENLEPEAKGYIAPLPVEYDASNRALAWLKSNNMLTANEQDGAKDALTWAARTYLVAALGSLAMLLYWGFRILGSRD